jgi:hypothetical protein
LEEGWKSRGSGKPWGGALGRFHEAGEGPAGGRGGVARAEGLGVLGLEAERGNGGVVLRIQNRERRAELEPGILRMKEDGGDRQEDRGQRQQIP